MHLSVRDMSLARRKQLCRSTLGSAEHITKANGFLYHDFVEVYITHDEVVLYHDGNTVHITAS